MSQIKKVVLAYSGGLDTSVILKWLQDTYRCEVVTFTADHRPGRRARARAQKGEAVRHQAEHIFIDDLREEFVRDFVFPMFRANAIYEGEYLLGTSIARPLIAKRQIEIATQDRRRCGVSRRHRQGQRSGALRARLLRAGAQHQGDRAVARMGSALAREAARLCRAARHSHRDEAQGRRLALFHGREPAAHLLRGAHPGRPGSRSRGIHVALDRIARDRRRTVAGVSRRSNTSKATSSRSTARSMTPATVLTEAESPRRQARHRPPRPGGKPLRRHEVARLLRNARRHHHAERASRHRVGLPGPRSRAPEGRPDAALREPDLQRLLVEPGAQGAAGAHRSHAAATSTAGCG